MINVNGLNACATLLGQVIMKLLQSASARQRMIKLKLLLTVPALRIDEHEDGLEGMEKCECVWQNRKEKRIDVQSKGGATAEGGTRTKCHTL